MVPKEIPLKYKHEGNYVISFLVDTFEDSVYVWQFCKAETAEWKQLYVTYDNKYKINANPSSCKGDKYRCLVKQGDQVVFYSKVYTVDYRKYNTDDEYAYKKQQYQYRQKEPSVADTDGMEGAQFEQYCAKVLKNNGFTDVRITQGSGDYGIDIIAMKDSISYAIQCKCYSNPVGNKSVQEAYSGKSFYNCIVAVVLTNNYFTKAAIETAKRNSVVLWDRDYLDGMIKRQEYSNQGNKQEKSEHHNRNRNYSEEDHKRNNESQQHNDISNSAVPDFFKGCTTWDHVKERYRKLMQTYHPDYETGSEEYAKAINIQYEALRIKFGK